MLLHATYLPRHPHCIPNHPPNQLPIRHPARCYLNHLLVPLLDAAFTLPEVRYVSRAVAYDLDLDVAEAIDGGLFGEDLLRGAFLDGARYSTGEFVGGTHEPDAAAASAVNSFDHDREAVLGGEGGDGGGGVGGVRECG